MIHFKDYLLLFYYLKNSLYKKKFILENWLDGKIAWIIVSIEKKKLEKYLY
jgi:hypothetical protein